MEYNGVDVSELQGDVDWNKVSSNNIKFAMIRASYGSSGLDSQFQSNMSNIASTDIYPGAYHQSSAQNVQEATDEANHFLNVIRPYKFFYPLALSIESDIAMQMGNGFFTDVIMAFLNLIKENGYYPMLATTVDILENNIDIGRLGGTDIWLAQPLPFSNSSTRPSYDKNITIFRSSTRGSISGIAGNANLDVSFVDYPTRIREQGRNRLNASNSLHGNESEENLEPDFSEPTFYTVAKGDSLRSIAKKVFGDPEQYRRLMELNGLSRPIIFAGQTLRIPQSINSNMMLYRVKSGDTLWKIAQRFLGYGPRYEEIMKLNDMKSDMIYPGQILKIPVESQIPSMMYTVKDGDTLWKIAQNNMGDGNRYIEIMRLNNLKNGSLKVGQLLRIPQK